MRPFSSITVSFWGQHRRKDGLSSLKRKFYLSFERKFDDLELGSK